MGSILAPYCIGKGGSDELGINFHSFLASFLPWIIKYISVKDKFQKITSHGFGSQDRESFKKLCVGFWLSRRNFLLKSLGKYFLKKFDFKTQSFAKTRRFVLNTFLDANGHSWMSSLFLPNTQRKRERITNQDHSQVSNTILKEPAKFLADCTSPERMLCTPLIEHGVIKLLQPQSKTKGQNCKSRLHKIH